MPKPPPGATTPTSRRLRIRFDPNGCVLRIVVETNQDNFPKGQWNALRELWSSLPDADLADRILVDTATTAEINNYLGQFSSPNSMSVELLGKRRFTVRQLSSHSCVAVDRQKDGKNYHPTFVALCIFFQPRHKGGNDGSRAEACRILTAFLRLGYTDSVIDDGRGQQNMATQTVITMLEASG